MKKMSINQDLNQRQFEKYADQKPATPEATEAAPIQKKENGYRQYIAPYLSEFEKIQEKGMENSRLNKRQQSQAVDFGKLNDAFSEQPSNNKLDKIDDYFESNA